MNMIVNKSDLVGYEAVEPTAAKKEALAKLVAAWESKQAQSARRFGGLGFLAVSLAACNSSTDDTTATTPATTTTTTPVVTTNNLAFTDDDATGGTPDVFTGTSGDDAPTATATGAAAQTLDAADVLTDPSTTDNDTLTVATTGAATSPAIVNGIENVVYNVTSFAAPAIAVDNIYGANITVNNLQLGGTTAVTVTGLGNGSTLSLGSANTGGTISVAGGTGAMTINAGAGVNTITAVSADGATVNATGTASTITIDGAVATAIATIVAGTGVTVASIDGTMATNAISNLTLSGAGTFTITDAPTAYTMTGAAGTVKGASSEFTTLTLTDSTTSGTTTLDISDVAAAMDLDGIGVDAINISGDASSAGANVMNVLSGQTVTISDALGHGLTISSDGSVPATGAVADTAEVLTLNVAVNAGQTLTVSDYETLTINTSGTATSLAFVGGATTDVTLNGGTTLALTAATAKSINAAAYTGAITHTATSAQAGTVTYGTGNDSVTATTAQTLVLDGGAGDDTLVLPADADGITFSNFEVITQATVTASDASQWAGKSAILNGGASITIDNADVATIDLSGYTLSAAGDFFIVSGALDGTKLLASTALTITGTKGTDQLTGTANADTINGGDGVDTISGAAGADIISGGAGADLITLGAGGDTVTGGAGADDFIVNKTDATGTTAAAIVTGMDKITDFGASTTATAFDGDEIDNAANVTTVASATAAASGTAQIATAGKLATFNAADNTLALKVTAIEAAINLGGAATDGQAAIFADSGNTYVFISDGTDGIAAGDALIELTGFDATGKTLLVNGNDAFIA